ncbi:YibE/F family protein [uncultured Actinomyces sp.]|uniref:YibE/F family protein n=1 Tax=uncultured Actinomyces sp. TaxID=249061 RepID=UPI002629A00B|nr:YibE/F family protein [uncultured Actinomyces sp.]
MTHQHAHISRTAEASTTSPKARLVIIVLLALITALTAVGAYVLRPNWAGLEHVQAHTGFQTAPGISRERAQILQVDPQCGSTALTASGEQSCVTLTVRLTTGEDAGKEVVMESPGPAAASHLSVGDVIQVISSPGPNGAPTYSFTGIERNLPILLFALLFVLVVLAVARAKGAMALVGLAFAVLVLVRFMLPSLASGRPGILVGVVGSSAIMLVVIHVAHGFSMRTASAMLGTFAGLVLAAFLGTVATRFGHLSGFVDETAFNLSASLPNLDMSQLLVAAIILSGLGVLNDVTITQSSAVWELRIASPTYTKREIYSSAMRIGRDHIASTIYTIVFAYTGAALASVMLIALFYDQPLSDLFTVESLAAEALQIFASGSALILSVPITTAIAVAAVRGPQAPTDKQTPEAQQALPA